MTNRQTAGRDHGDFSLDIGNHHALYRDDEGLGTLDVVINRADSLVDQPSEDGGVIVRQRRPLQGCDMARPEELAEIAKIGGKNGPVSGPATFNQTCLAASNADLHDVDLESLPARRRQ